MNNPPVIQAPEAVTQKDTGEDHSIMEDLSELKKSLSENMTKEIKEQIEENMADKAGKAALTALQKKLQQAEDRIELLSLANDNDHEDNAGYSNDEVKQRLESAEQIVLATQRQMSFMKNEQVSNQNKISMLNENILNFTQVMKEESGAIWTAIQQLQNNKTDNAHIKQELKKIMTKFDVIEESFVHHRATSTTLGQFQNSSLTTPAPTRADYSNLLDIQTQQILSIVKKLENLSVKADQSQKICVDLKQRLANAEQTILETQKQIGILKIEQDKEISSLNQNVVNLTEVVKEESEEIWMIIQQLQDNGTESVQIKQEFKEVMEKFQNIEQALEHQRRVSTTSKQYSSSSLTTPEPTRAAYRDDNDLLAKHIISIEDKLEDLEVKTRLVFKGTSVQIAYNFIFSSFTLQVIK